MPVYVDVLLVINGFINYLMLLCVMKFLHLKTGRLRILLGAAAGSIFSLKIFLPQTSILSDLIIRIAACILITVISFKTKNVKFFLRAVLSFLAVNFAFGGLISAIIYFIKPGVLLYDNGTVYFNINFVLLAVLSVISFAVISTIQKITERRSPEQSIYEIKINKDGKTCTGRALADTGSNLRDPFSGAPVIVAQYADIKTAAPVGICKYCENPTYDNIAEDIRLIPVSTVSSSGFLPAFKADSVCITGIKCKKEARDIYIAVSRQPLCSGEFEFILNTEILEDNNDDKPKTARRKSSSENTEALCKKRERNLLHKRTRNASAAAL